MHSTSVICATEYRQVSVYLGWAQMEHSRRALRYREKSSSLAPALNLGPRFDICPFSRRLL